MTDDITDKNELEAAVTTETEVSALLSCADFSASNSRERADVMGINVAVIEYVADMTQEFMGIAHKRGFQNLAYFLDMAHLQAREDIRELKPRRN